MIDSPHKNLRQLLDYHVGGRGSAALAVIPGGGATANTVWTPADVAEEPAFLAYSITKSFTAAAFLLFQEQGLLSLDARLAEWFPDIPGADGMTLRQVLQHTAGLPDYGGLPAYSEAVRNFPLDPWTFEKFVQETLAGGLAFEAGEDWGYSNLGFMFLKRIAEQVVGESFSAVLSRYIIRPLALARTVVPECVADLTSLAPAFSTQLSPDGTPLDVREYYHPGWVSHGVVASTPSEIATFYDALFRGRLLSAESLKQMTTLVPVPIYDSASLWNRPSYGLGLMADPQSRYGPTYGHNGGGPGYNASAYYAPNLGREGVTVCVMCGIEKGFDAERLVLEVMEGISDSSTAKG